MENLFNYNWELCKFEKLTDFFSGLTYSPDNVQKDGTFVLRSSNVKDNAIVSADNVYVRNEVANSEHVQVGDVIVVVRNGSRSLIGKHAPINREMPNTVIGAFMTGLRSPSPKFLKALLDTQQFNVEIHKNLGATINQITTGEFKRMHFTVPIDEDEKEKIGSLFRQLDDIIALHQRKLDQLKELKTAYLQVIFPVKDERVPKLRFADFEEEWELCKLGDLANIVGGGTPNTNNPKCWDGNIDWYAPAEIKEKIYVTGSKKRITELGLQKSSAKVLPIGTVLFTSRAGIGNTAILAKKGTTNQGFQSIIPNKNKLDTYFIFSRTHELKKYGEAVGAGSTFVEVSGKQMAKMPMLTPRFNEQQAIGMFFKKIDDIITLHQNKLEQLKDLKTSYLQNMFI
ncbi:restriction endonuclease subunit S [Enterococcus faecalis]|uniref:restriction endonuclease subunit S n=1 Tax=Enterococcus faecalis TaxID=1351 RepID=UPI0015721F04|nr:restriction endonuclease subunit S [Enterococcus faecalis]EGO5178989.1 restriction endonuclease subunit S [Enterococcus faecalis]EHR4599208.1 restriction endonuclease subunit S [Enterococcus faecalis]EIV0105222.1 restriction endonuclease subunit S [Enterococcus faecalis]EIZ1495063.1 restriction endonuclease subunit S [Enterococcus faecalis]EJR1582274.1 restriction endonuclease subunit S [Enterococcus faecalis]